MTVLRKLVSSLQWWRLVPDDVLIVEDAESDAFPATAARADDGSFALVYLPTGRQLRLDLTRLAGDAVEARWFDPASGRSLDVQGSPFAAGESLLTLTSPDGDGAGDWILLLTSETGDGVDR